MNNEKEIKPITGIVVKKEAKTIIVKNKKIKNSIVMGGKIMDFKCLIANINPLTNKKELSPLSWLNVILDKIVDEIR